MTLLQPQAWLGLSKEPQPGSPYSSNHSVFLLPLGPLSSVEGSNTLWVQRQMDGCSPQPLKALT